MQVSVGAAFCSLGAHCGGPRLAARPLRVPCQSFPRKPLKFNSRAAEDSIDHQESAKSLGSPDRRLARIRQHRAAPPPPRTGILLSDWKNRVGCGGPQPCTEYNALTGFEPFCDLRIELWGATRHGLQSCSFSCSDSYSPPRSRTSTRTSTSRSTGYLIPNDT